MKEQRRQGRGGPRGKRLQDEADGHQLEAVHQHQERQKAEHGRERRGQVQHFSASGFRLPAFGFRLPVSSIRLRASAFLIEMKTESLIRKPGAESRKPA
jgi:hypothetical protein